jgi:transposase
LFASASGTKKKTLSAEEQNREDVREKREEWRQAAAALAIECLVFLDETGAKTNMTRLYGRAENGDRVNDSAPAGHWNTTTLIAAVGKDGPIAPFLIEGAIDGDVFLAYVEKFLAPALRPGDILVMDNLSTHKSAAALRLIEKRGASVLFLPPYSPDYNPIEKMWSKIKALLRKAAARTAEDLTNAVKAALNAVTADDIRGWFRSCGYNI